MSIIEKGTLLVNCGEINSVVRFEHRLQAGEQCMAVTFNNEEAYLNFQHEFTSPNNSNIYSLVFEIKAPPNSKLYVQAFAHHEYNCLNLDNYLQTMGGNPISAFNNKWQRVVIPVQHLVNFAHGSIRHFKIGSKDKEPLTVYMDQMRYTDEQFTPKEQILQTTSQLLLNLSADTLEVMIKFMNPIESLKLRLVSTQINKRLMNNELFVNEVCRHLCQGEMEFNKFLERTINKPIFHRFKQAILERNLIRNPFGNQGLDHWDIVRNEGNGFRVENWGALEGVQNCFVTSYGWCIKKQTIDLESKGFTPSILRTLPLKLIVYDHHSGRGDCGSEFRFRARLIGIEENEIDEKEQSGPTTPNSYQRVQESFTVSDDLAFVELTHAGKDTQYWSGWYGARLCGAGVRFQLDDSYFFEE